MALYNQQHIYTLSNLLIVDKHSLILLDVMVENLHGSLLDKGWNVKTVTVVLGAVKEARNDTKILEYAKTNNCAIITEDKGFIKRLRDEDMKVFTVTDAEMTDIIHQKLLSELD